MATTISVSQANEGTVIASSGSITALRCTTSPTPGTYHWFNGLLTLAETGRPGIPKELYNIHAPTYFVIAGTHLFDNCAIPFVQLTLAHCPVGAQFELDLA
jgi:hypothetical protein